MRVLHLLWASSASLKKIIILNLHHSSWLIYLVQNPERTQETVVPLQGHRTDFISRDKKDNMSTVINLFS